MWLRVYDKRTNSYFVSEIYAIINSGYYEKYLVLDERNNKVYWYTLIYKLI